jgi:hypothetical protein
MFELKDVLTILSILIANGAVLATAFTKLNIRIAEIAQDQNALKAKMDSHIYDNKSEIKEVKDSATKDRDGQKVDTANVMKEIAVLNRNISDLRVEIVKAMKTKC